MKLSSDLESLICNKKLPGEDAQRLMTPVDRMEEASYSYRDAAVAILLFENSGQIYFPIIRRVVDGDVHSNQMALPGGKVDAGEQPSYAAIRELHEEIDAKVGAVRIVRELTSLKVPVSGYKIHPFVALYNHDQAWSRQQDEIDQIFNVSLLELLDQSSIFHAQETSNEMPKGAPYFVLEGQKVWGATAMILSEFRQLLIG